MGLGRVRQYGEPRARLNLVVYDSYDCGVARSKAEYEAAFPAIFDGP